MWWFAGVVGPFVAFFLFLTSNSAFAESAVQSTVPGPSEGVLRKPAEGTELGWTSHAEGSFLLNSGNSEAVSLGIGADTLYKQELWSTRGAGKYMNNSSGGTRQAEIFSLDARGDRKISGPFDGFAQLGFFRNVFAGFRSRYSGDLGIAWNFLEEPVQRLALEGSLGAINENRTTTNQTFVSAKATINYTRKLTATSDLENAFSLMQNLDNSADWRVSNVLAISFIMNEILSTKLSLRVDHLHQPVAGRSPPIWRRKFRSLESSS